MRGGSVRNRVTGKGRPVRAFNIDAAEGARALERSWRSAVARCQSRRGRLPERRAAELALLHVGMQAVAARRAYEAATLAAEVRWQMHSTAEDDASRARRLAEYQRVASDANAREGLWREARERWIAAQAAGAATRNAVA